MTWFTEASDTYLSATKANQSPSTYINYRNFVGRLTRFLNGREITLPIAEQYLYSLGWKPSSIAGETKRIKAFMRFCLDHEYYTQEWFKKIKAPEVITNGNDIRLPGIETALKIIIAGTELQHWYNKVATQVNKDMRLALTLVLYTGLRFAELTKLTGDDIVLDGAIPVIMVTSKGKGGAKEQQSIPDSIVEDMRALKERKQLFPITNGTCNLALKRGIKILKLDIPTFTVHKLRHIFANDLMENDINPYKLKGLMRHSKFATTETYYLHKDQTDLSKQVNIYNSLSRKSRSSAEKLDYYFKQFSRMAGEEMAVSIDKESGRITASII